MTTDPLRAVRHTAMAVTVAIYKRDAAIRGAVEAECSLREVADAAGVSHQTVANIVARLT